MDEEHASITALTNWLNSLQVFARNHEEGQIEELLEAAAMGALEDSGDETTPIKPIRLDPEVYELRYTALKKKLRFYHGEPVEMPFHLVKLHRHIKRDNPSQQAEIEHAARRYKAGRNVYWTKDQ